MSFLTYEFLLFFLPLTALLIAVVRKRSLQNAALAAMSVFFYACFGMAGLFFLLYSAAITYAFGRVGYHLTQTGRKTQGTRLYTAGILLNLLPLVLFKYAGFAVQNANRLLIRFGMTMPVPNLLLPVGLSFFIFQSSTYLFDLYREKTQPERNPINYLLFVSFFPTISSGPIQRSTALLPQIRERKRVSLTRVQNAALLFVWGALLKLVLADRLKIFTDAVFSSYSQYGSIELFAGASAYSVQIYADFLAYTCMATALASLFGFDLADNFRQPYLATSMADFWHRWHISLTSWLTDYIYIPLGGSRKGQIRRYINIALVFLISGLWHGAAWNFVAWGALHALFQIAGHMTRKARESLCDRLHINRSTQGYRCLQRVCIFLLVTVAWILFRMESLRMAMDYIIRMITLFNPWALTDGTMSAFGLTASDWNICILSTAALIGVSLAREKGLRLYTAFGAIPKALLFTFLLCMVVILGLYGGTYDASAFIYTGF